MRSIGRQINGGEASNLLVSKKGSAEWFLHVIIFEDLFVVGKHAQGNALLKICVFDCWNLFNSILEWCASESVGERCSCGKGCC